jgi:hypothetical protein
MSCRRMHVLVVMLAIGALNSATGYAQIPALQWYMNPNESMVGACFGNCGAGCTAVLEAGIPAPCGGPKYWTQEVFGPVARDAVQETQELCVGGRIWVLYYDYYTAPGRYTYHGHSSLGCRQHDQICREWGWAPCLALAIQGLDCAEGRDENWSYDTTMVAVTAQPVHIARTTSTCAVGVEQ